MLLLLVKYQFIFIYDFRATVRAYNKFNIATVGVGFPATPLLQSRIRFCMSAALSKEQLDEVIMCKLYNVHWIRQFAQLITLNLLIDHCH